MKLASEVRGHMQYCTKCGSVIQEGEDFCSKCGYPVRQGQTAPRAERTTSAPTQSGGSGGAAIALGVIGILVGFLFVPLVGIILGIVAIALGSSASSQGDKNGGAGIALGITSLILSIIAWVIAITIIFSYM
jgi:predicted nucleic acid-binding Zn ribbon protein